MQHGNVIILYGPIATGKLTVGKILSAKLGYRLSHNHLINDLAWSIYDRNSVEGNQFIEDLRFKFFEEVAKSHINLVTTHAYAHNFVSLTGLSDPEYMKKLEAIFEKHQINVHFVYLTAKKEILLERVGHTNRSEFRKLTNKDTMENILREKDTETPAPLKQNIVIDNSDFTPEETASKILQAIQGSES